MKTLPHSERTIFFSLLKLARMKSYLKNKKIPRWYCIGRTVTRDPCGTAVYLFCYHGTTIEDTQTHTQKKN